MREKLKVDDVKDEQDCRHEDEVIEDSTEQIDSDYRFQILLTVRNYVNLQ